MKLNLSFEKGNVEYRITAYGEKEDLSQIIQAVQDSKGFVCFCCMKQEDKKESVDEKFSAEK